MDAGLFRQLCDEHDTNATKIAADCGLNRNTIGRWIKGTGTPMLNTAYAVAEILETEVTKLWPRPRSKKNAR